VEAIVKGAKVPLSRPFSAARHVPLTWTNPYLLTIPPNNNKNKNKRSHTNKVQKESKSAHFGARLSAPGLTNILLEKNSFGTYTEIMNQALSQVMKNGGDGSCRVRTMNDPFLLFEPPATTIFSLIKIKINSVGFYLKFGFLVFYNFIKMSYARLFRAPA
jgi:hypothetical protein